MGKSKELFMKPLAYCHENTPCIELEIGVECAFNSTLNSFLQIIKTAYSFYQSRDFLT